MNIPSRALDETSADMAYLPLYGSALGLEPNLHFYIYNLSNLQFNQPQAPVIVDDKNVLLLT